MKTIKVLRATLILFLFLFLFTTIPQARAAPKTFTSIHGRVVDAVRGLPIPNATVVLWDLGPDNYNYTILSTDEEGRYNATDPFVQIGEMYRVYAYHQSAATLDYVPSAPNITTLTLLSPVVNVNFSLVPGASIRLLGDMYYVESASPSNRFEVSVVDWSTGLPPNVHNARYLSVYGDTTDTWLLNKAGAPIDRRLVIIPANTNVDLKVKAYFLLHGKRGWAAPIDFYVDNETRHFYLPQGSHVTHAVEEYSLRISSEVVKGYIHEAQREVDEAQRVGFYVSSELKSLAQARFNVEEATEVMEQKEYWESFLKFRKAYMKAYTVFMNLHMMRLIATANAVYMPAFFAVYAVTLAFFISEKRMHKLILTLAFYIALVAALYWIYPGTPLILKLNSTLFLEASVAFISVVLAVVFGLPHVWGEPAVESRAPLRSFVPIIFSMAKRQIRLRKLRGFFTITSLVTLVIAFTSLTSFGTVFGLASRDLPGSPPDVGVVVNRSNVTFTPMWLTDLKTLRGYQNIQLTSIKVENLPDPNPVVVLLSADNKYISLHGVLGVTPSNETRFTHLDQVMEPGKGSYLDDADADSILISVKAAEKMGVEAGAKVRLYVRGIEVPLQTFTIKGLFNDERFTELVDLDTNPFRPTTMVDSEVVPCNSSDVVIMNWQTALNLQDQAEALLKSVPRFAEISRVALLFSPTTDLEPIIWDLVMIHRFNVFLSVEGKTTMYYQGYSYEARGLTELLIPLAMVVLNVGAVMLNAVYERKSEMMILSTIGLNPGHVALTFVAEAIVLGLVGGGLGYVLGLGFYRITTLFGAHIMVREKLEWWWSVVGLAIAIIASVLSAVRPAALAVKMYTPSAVGKLKRTPEERESGRKKSSRSTKRGNSPCQSAS